MYKGGRLLLRSLQHAHAMPSSCGSATLVMPSAPTFLFGGATQRLCIMYDIGEATKYKCGETDLHTTYDEDLTTDQPTVTLDELREYIVAYRGTKRLYNEVAAHFGQPIGLANVSPCFSLELEEESKIAACAMCALLGQGTTILRYNEDSGVLSM